MSQENVEIARRCCEAFNRGEYEAALDALDPEIEYDMTHFPDGQVYSSREGVREAFRIWLGTWDDYRQEQEDFTTPATRSSSAIGSTDGEREVASS